MEQLWTLLAGEARQERTKGLRAGPFAVLVRRIGAASQPHRQGLAVAMNFPPSPRIGVRLLNDDKVSRGIPQQLCVTAPIYAKQNRPLRCSSPGSEGSDR
jgi:hypothetical protein